MLDSRLENHAACHRRFRRLPRIGLPDAIPAAATACLLLAPGAGAGMNHAYMVALSAGLAARGIATLRYQFPYMEKGSRRPDPPALCHQTVRAVVAAAHGLVARAAPVRGRQVLWRSDDLAGAGPRAPAARSRACVSSDFRCIRRSNPRSAARSTWARSRFRCCSCRAHATSWLTSRCCARCSSIWAHAVTLKVIEHADHSFHVLVRSGTTDEKVLETMLDDVAAWIAAPATRSP